MVRLLIIFIAFFFGMQTYAADCGRFAVVKQPVQWKKQGKKKFKKATKNKQICQGATVKTGPNGRVKIVMDDNNEINVSPNTELVIESYKGGKKAVLNVLNGKVRSDVNNKYDNNKSSHFRVKTKSAVAGVRGTQFLTSFNARTNQIRVTTFEGKVEVGRMDGGSFVSKVTVNPGQFTSGSQSQDPHPPKEVPPAELAQMDRESKVNSSPGGKSPASNNAQPKKEKEEPKKEEPKQQAPPADDNKDGQKGDEASDGKRRGKGPGAKGPKPKGPNAKAPGVDGPDADGGDLAREDDQFGDPNFDPAKEGSPDGGDLAREDDQFGDPNFDPAKEGSPDGGRDIASIDGCGEGMCLPPPTLDDMPELADGSGYIEPPSFPTLDPIIDDVPQCIQCNDAVINQKVRVIIRVIDETTGQPLQ